MEPLVGSSGQVRKDKNWKVRVTVVGGGETEERNGAEREAALWEKAHFKACWPSERAVMIATASSWGPRGPGHGGELPPSEPLLRPGRKKGVGSSTCCKEPPGPQATPGVLPGGPRCRPGPDEAFNQSPAGYGSRLRGPGAPSFGPATAASESSAPASFLLRRSSSTPRDPSPTAPRDALCPPGSPHPGHPRRRPDPRDPLRLAANCAVAPSPPLPWCTSW